MNLEILTALIGFAFVSSVTPGPNNMMLLASGANFGLRRSVPHMLGISIGHSFMVTMVGLGLGRMFELYPASFIAMKVVSVAYLIYLAWKIANAAPPKAAQATGKPFSFLQAAAFQWVNPKAWYMAVTAVTNFTPDTGLADGRADRGGGVCHDQPALDHPLGRAGHATAAPADQPAPPARLQLDDGGAAHGDALADPDALRLPGAGQLCLVMAIAFGGPCNDDADDR